MSSRTPPFPDLQSTHQSHFFSYDVETHLDVRLGNTDHAPVDLLDDEVLNDEPLLVFLVESLLESTRRVSRRSEVHLGSPSSLFSGCLGGRGVGDVGDEIVVLRDVRLRVDVCSLKSVHVHGDGN